MQFKDDRLKTHVAKSVCRGFTVDDDENGSKQTLTMMISRGFTIDDDDNGSKQTLTMMINRRRIGTRCHNDRVVGEENDEKAFIFVE